MVRPSSPQIPKKSSKPSEADSKNSAINLALEQIEKQYGVGAIMRMGERGDIHIERFPSGSLALDIAMGGGVPRGRILEIFGPESSGKTTLALHMIAELQKLKGQAAFIDAEHALDVQYAKKIGVDVDNLLVSSRMTANPHSKSPRHSCAPVLWTSS